jgi:hypothetical protein
MSTYWTKLKQKIWKKIWRLLKKLKIDLPNDPTISLLSDIHEGM